MINIFGIKSVLKGFDNSEISYNKNVLLDRKIYLEQKKIKSGVLKTITFRMIQIRFLTEKYIWNKKKVLNRGF